MVLKRQLFFFFLFGSLIGSVISAKESSMRHNLSVSFNKDSSMLFVSDTIQLLFLVPNEIEAMHFSLNKNLMIQSSNVELIRGKESDENLAYYDYRLKVSDIGDDSLLILRYHGVIDNNKAAFSSPRGMMGTRGIVFENGIYLGGESYWVPFFQDVPLVTFEMEVNIDKEWSVMSQGDEVLNRIEGNKRRIKHVCFHPSNQVYLVANKWVKYQKQSGKVSLEAYLMSDDQALADKYLSATEQYLSMYEGMLGAYPYNKFALIENFWESGMGMPSFTLLGQKVIRMPWIIYSSYPHELLHNYWGNSVYVDTEYGNWSEGVTTYMADYFFKEMKGEGSAYRKNALQNFSNYVTSENDFPVKDFRSRTDKVSSSIGYDKVVMINHMLRRNYGKERYLSIYRNFYHQNAFSYATFKDIQVAFESDTGDDLSVFFDQWIMRKGAPLLALNNVSRTKHGSQYTLSFTVEQLQEEAAFQLDVPIAVVLDGQKEPFSQVFRMNKKRETYSVELNSQPVQVACDADFDLMRKLADGEIPATLSGLMGAEEITMVLPSADKNLGLYQRFAQAYKSMNKRTGNKVNVVLDAAFDASKSHSYIWILGDSNRYARSVTLSEEHLAIIEAARVSGQGGSEQKGETMFYTFKKDNVKLAYLHSSTPQALMTILMKLRHYGQYSFLGFKGEDGSLEFKGIFPVKDSPMVFSF